ncbi:MAG TPA: LPS export ABC transporter permease LptF [Rhizomicrobium sp.]|jgi:lipopolysaccharide export system permease protein
MPRLSTYVLRQLVGPILLFAFLLTCVIWLSQSLKLLDLVINRNQSAPTFIYLTLLILPQLLVIILPLAYFAGTLQSLHRLNSESELVVMQAAGYSRAQLMVPVLLSAVAVMALTYFCALWLMPLCQRTMKEQVLDIRADLGAAILNEGQFNTPVQGLTVFIRALDPDGQIHGILVHDNRNVARPTTYLAESGVLAQTNGGGRLIMRDGTIEQATKGGARLSMLKFQRYTFDLDQFAGPQQDVDLDTSERYLPELLWPKLTKDPGGKLRKRYLAEANNRLAAPLYCLAFAMIALAAITRGRRGRGAYALRLTVASLFAAAIRIIGYGLQGAAGRNASLNILMYALPLFGAAVALIDIAGFDLGALFERFRATPHGEPAQ